MATFPRPGARHGVYSASGRARSSNRCPDACIYRACRKGASRALLRHCRKGTNVHCLRESAGPFRDGGGQRVPPTNQPKQSKADRPTSSARLAHSRRAIRAMPTPVEVSVFRRKLAGHACMCSVLLDGNAEMRSCAVRGLVAAVLMPRGAASYGSWVLWEVLLGTVRAMQCGTAATTRRGGDSADRDSRACTRRSHTSSSLGSSS